VDTVRFDIAAENAMRGMLIIRQGYKMRGEWGLADKIRTALNRMGYRVEDYPNGHFAVFGPICNEQGAAGVPNRQVAYA